MLHYELNVTFFARLFSPKKVGLHIFLDLSGSIIKIIIAITYSANDGTVFHVYLVHKE